MELNTTQYISKLKTELQKHVNFKSDEDNKLFYTEENLVKDLEDFCPEKIATKALEMYVTSVIKSTEKALNEKKNRHDVDIKFIRAKGKFERREKIDEEVVAYYRAQDPDNWGNYGKGNLSLWNSEETIKRKEQVLIKEAFEKIHNLSKQQLKEYNNYCFTRRVLMSPAQAEDYTHYMGIASLKTKDIIISALRKEFITMSPKEICVYCKEYEKTLNEMEIKEFKYTIGREINWGSCHVAFIRELGLSYIFAPPHKMKSLNDIFTRLESLHIAQPFSWKGIPKRSDSSQYYGYNYVLTENNLQDYFELFKCSDYMLVLLKKSGDVITMLDKLIYDCNSINMKEWLLDNKSYLLRDVTRCSNPEEQKTRQNKIWKRIENMDVVTKEDIENYERVKKLLQ